MLCTGFLASSTRRERILEAKFKGEAQLGAMLNLSTSFWAANLMIFHRNILY